LKQLHCTQIRLINGRRNVLNTEWGQRGCTHRKVRCLFYPVIDIDNSLTTQRPTATTARVVLPNPSADNDTDEDVGEDGEAEEIDDGDFLADFPDNTEVCCYFGCI
jgi:hypothetical protein